MLHHIKLGLCAKPPSKLTPDRLPSIHGIFFRNLDRLASPASRSRISQQLRMAALLQTHEPEHGALDTLAAGEQTVVLQKSGFLVAERFGNGEAFFFSQHDAAEGGVECNVVVEGARVLCDSV